MSEPWEDFDGDQPTAVEDGPWSDFAAPDVPTSFVPASQAGIPLTSESFEEYQRTTPQVQEFSPMGDRAGQPDTEFTDALFNRLPTDIGNVAKAIPEEAAAVVSLLQRPPGQEVGLLPSFGAVRSAVEKNLPYAPLGNIKAALQGKSTPVDAAIRESALESAERGDSLAAETLARTSQGLAATAPLLVGIGLLPKAAQVFASAGFSLDMIRHAPELFKDYAEEINKPKEEQNPDAIAELQAGIIQTFAFAPLAGAHAGRGIAEKLTSARKIASDPVPIERTEQQQIAAQNIGIGNELNQLKAQLNPTPEQTARIAEIEAQDQGTVQRAAWEAQMKADLEARKAPSVVPIKETGGVTSDPLTPPVSGEQPLVPTPGKPAAKTVRAKNAQTQLQELDALVIQHGIETGRIDDLELLHSPRETATSNIGSGIKAKVQYNAELKAARERVASDLGMKGKMDTPAGRAELLAKLKEIATRPAPPKLRPGEKGTGELLQGEDAPFNLTGERAVDAERIAAEKKAKEDAEKEAVEFEETNQGDMFPEGVGNPSDWTNALESLKFKADKDGKVIPDDPGQVFSLPHPDAVKQIGKQVWNDAIDVALAAIRAGKAIKLALDDALTHIRKNAVGKFDETQARNNLESIFPKTEVSSDEGRMRKLSERATTSEKIPEPVQEQIKGSPESYYRQQNLSKVEERVRGMSDAELGAVARDSDIYTAAKLEQATRLFDSGNSDAGYRVFQDLSTELTRLGQVINQAKLFQALRPEHVVTVVNKELVKAGKDPLTPDQAGRVQGLAAERITKQADLQKATDEWVKDPTDANAVKAEKALTDANKAALDEQNLVNQFKPRSLPAIIKSILQGNLLVPMSHVANVVGNVNFMPFRAGVRTIASGIDILDSYLRNRPRQVSVAPIKGGRPAAAGLIKGVKQIPAILAKGTGEVIKGESRAGLHPLRAWVKQFSKNPDIPTVGGKIPFSERVNLAIEGTFGVPAEVMLRVLGAGDIPFSEMARSRLIAEQSRLSKLSPGDARMAKDFPELFFDKAALDKINNETRGAVFQRHSKTLDHLLSWIKGRGDWFDLAVAFVAPYKLTPWNIVGEILSYNPLIAMGRTALEAKRGNIRAAEMNAAKVIVGSTLVYAGYWLYEKGLLSPSLDDKGEQQKARILAGEVMPPNHVNLSGLKRAMAGGDPAFKAGDETVDIFRGGGLAGSMFYMMANVGRDAETKPEAEQAILSLLKNSTLEQARFGLNQSFLKGVTGLLDAVRDGDADTYVQSLAGTVLSVPLPNTLSAISRAERKYKVDATDKNLIKQVEKVVRTRLGFVGMDDYLPLKRGLWGEPMRETPENRNALVYHFFDISKNRQVTSDPVPLELYRLWRKTANTSVIPTPPDKTLTVGGETYLMNPEQRSRYAELIGTARRSITSQIVTNPEWHKIPDEKKIDLLEKVYANGLKVGKAQFFDEVGDNLEKKPKKAGFK